MAALLQQPGDFGKLVKCAGVGWMLRGGELNGQLDVSEVAGRSADGAA